MSEALVNAIAYRDYSISGTQVDIDIYDDRIDITSPGSWLLPKSFKEYELSSIPSIRRNEVIASCFDVANLMERSGSGFQTIFDVYKPYGSKYQPSVLCYADYFILRLKDVLYDNQADVSEYIEKEEHTISTSIKTTDDTPIQKRILDALSSSPLEAKELQEIAGYTNRYRFLKDVMNPLMKKGLVERTGKAKSKNSLFRLKEK